VAEAVRGEVKREAGSLEPPLEHLGHVVGVQRRPSLRAEGPLSARIVQRIGLFSARPLGRPASSRPAVVYLLHRRLGYVGKQSSITNVLVKL
jgi:hypothetical protein